MTPAQADELRASMVAELVDRDVIAHPAVVAAMLAVPRHRFVPRSIEYDELRRVYSADNAFGIKMGSSALLSSLSAPVIVGSMAELLDLRRGMRVLEVGAGGGYNAAVLAEIVGQPSLVTTIDIDPEVAAWARNALDATGFGDVAVMASDGFFGAPDRAPFDRVIATVGCTDLAPAWIEQLRPDGFALVPLEHGGLHPLTKAAPTGGGRAEGVLVGRSGFVRVQGVSDRTLRWPRSVTPGAHARRLPLPPELAIFRGGVNDLGTEDAWSFYYYLSLADPRAVLTGSMVDGGSGLILFLAEGHVLAWGDESLYEDLLAHVRRWRALGSPGLECFVSQFVPIDEPAPAVGQPSWVIDRIAYRQYVRVRDR